MDSVGNAHQQLHVGCGYARLEGWTNADLYRTPATDVTFDLQQPWPIGHASQKQILASHVVEHLADWQTFFREAWQCLEPGGLLYIRVPYGGHPAAFWDFGHVRPWFVENWTFFQPGYSRAIGNPQHQGWQWPFDVEMIDIRVSSDLVRLLKFLPFRWWRNLVFPLIRHGAYALEELFVRLRPLKSHDEVKQWLALNAPNCLRVQYVCWQHQWTGIPLAPGEVAMLRVLGVGNHLNGYN